MDAEVFERALRAFCTCATFRPFLVELASGKLLLVEHPEALAAGPDLAVYIGKRGELTILDQQSVVRFSNDISEFAKRPGDAGAA